jgi:hypothetical protein
MENRIRITEAINHAHKKGISFKKSVDAHRVFGGLHPYHSLNNMEKGHCKTIDRKTVLKMCQVWECDANLLFGIEPKTK